MLFQYCPLAPEGRLASMASCTALRFSTRSSFLKFVLPKMVCTMPVLSARNSTLPPLNSVTLAAKSVDTVPVFDGLAAANGSLYLAGKDGTLRSFGAEGTDLESKLGEPIELIEEELIPSDEEYRKETLCEGWALDHVKLRGVMGEPETVRGAPWDCPGSLLQFPNSSTTAAGFVLNDEGGCL